MKEHIRTIGPIYKYFTPCAYGFVEIKVLLWHDEREKEALRKYINSLGFYVLTGTGDSLDVFVLSDNSIISDVKRIWKEIYESVFS